MCPESGRRRSPSSVGWGKVLSNQPTNLTNGCMFVENTLFWGYTRFRLYRYCDDSQDEVVDRFIVQFQYRGTYSRNQVYDFNVDKQTFGMK